MMPGPNQWAVSTGITAGQLPQAQINQAVNTAKAPLGAPQFTHAQPQQSELARMFQDSTRASGSSNAIQLDRAGSNQQAQMRNSFQNARSNAGLGWANLGANFNAIDNSTKSLMQNYLWSMLGNQI